MADEQRNLVPETEDFRSACMRIDGYLSVLTASDDFIDLSSGNEELLQLAFVARGVVRELVIPSKEIIEAIFKAEAKVKRMVDEYVSEDSEEELENEDEDE